MRLLTKNYPSTTFMTYPSLLDTFFSDDLFSSFRSAVSKNNFDRLIPANIREDENHYHIELAAPGISKDEFIIEFKDGLLTISVSDSNESTKDETEYALKEFSRSSMKRTFNIKDQAIDLENSTANHENGILRVSLKKAEKIENTHRINIQ